MNSISASQKPVSTSNLHPPRRVENATRASSTAGDQRVGHPTDTRPVVDEANSQTNPSSQQGRTKQALSDESGQSPEILKERQQTEALKRRHREVLRHEAAHLAAAGNLAVGGAQFNYEVGPDGQRYAVSGEVEIESAQVAGDPEQTLVRARRIQAAALAPAEPSAQDRRVASQAAAIVREAQSEIQQANQDTSSEDKVSGDKVSEGPRVDQPKNEHAANSTPRDPIDQYVDTERFAQPASRQPVGQILDELV